MIVKCIQHMLAFVTRGNFRACENLLKCISQQTPKILFFIISPHHDLHLVFVVHISSYAALWCCRCHFFLLVNMFLSFSLPFLISLDNVFELLTQMSFSFSCFSSLLFNRREWNNALRFMDSQFHSFLPFNKKNTSLASPLIRIT